MLSRRYSGPLIVLLIALLVSGCIPIGARVSNMYAAAAAAEHAP